MPASPWRKSSYSKACHNCVEVGAGTRAVAVRDTRNPGGPVLTFTAGAWRTFTGAVKRRKRPASPAGGRPAIPPELAGEILAAAWAGEVSADLSERIQAETQAP